MIASMKLNLIAEAWRLQPLLDSMNDLFGRFALLSSGIKDSHTIIANHDKAC